MSANASGRTRAASRLLALFGEGISGIELAGKARESDLLPEEREYVVQAVEARRIEFAGGRLCARAALAQQGAEPSALLVGKKRAPAWPAGFVGSITHTQGYCAAVAGKTTQWAGIGIDVEQRGALERELEGEICTPEELLWLEQQEPSLRRDLATLLFSAKEAFFKCQSCITGDWLGFLDVTLHVNLEQGGFRVVPKLEIPGVSGRELSGRYLLGDEHLFTGIGIQSHTRL